MFPLAAAFGGYYGLYIAVLRLLINAAVCLSVLVSLDRMINITKFLYFKARAKLTGYLPEHDWAFPALPNDPLSYPKVCGPSSTGRAGSTGRSDPGCEPSPTQTPY